MPEPFAAARGQPLNSLATKIIFFVFLSTFLTALAVSWISIESTHRFLREAIDQRFPALLQRSASRVEAWLSGAQSDAEARAGAPALRAIAGSLRSGADGAETRKALDLAAQSGRPLAAVRGLVLLHPSGAIAATWGDPPALPPELVHGLRTLGEPDVQSVRDPSGAPLVLASAPVRSADGGVAAVLVALLRTDDLGLLLAGEGEEAPTRITLVGADGMGITSSQLADGASCAAADDRGPAGGDAACADSPGTWSEVKLPPTPPAGRAVSDYQRPSGERVIGAARRLSRLGWTVMAEEPFERAFEPVLSVVTRIFVTDLVIVLLFSFLAYKITAAIVRPIEALSDGARRISRGELDLEIPDTRGNDEIGLLTRTFNDMTRKLRKNQSEIETAIHQLTVQKQELEKANEQLSQLSITDGLTKLHNHRFFQDHLTREIKRVQRSGEPLSILLVDIDDFKRLNDRLGHAAGDELLTRIARIMDESMRASDLLARYGGEEFVILAGNTDLGGAATLGEKVREAVGEKSFLLDETMRLEKVTVSVGVAQYKGDRKAFFQAADRALYRAKAQGKNCVRAEGDGVV
ncbi:MAG TPA: diguanylate cyclase [Myxococcota bacterium]|nr:diguanylate cyclase [Myxococcota bacterium]